MKLKPFQRRSLHLEARDVTVTATVTMGVSTILLTLTNTLEAPTPLVTSTETVFSEAPTPLATQTATSYFEAATPLFTKTQTEETPIETATVTSTVTLPQQVTTTTSTVYARSTACAQKVVYTQPTCPRTQLGTFLVGETQEALLKLYKKLSGKQVLIDCGTGGQYLY
ncbi:hypothetical protein Rhopal_007041-T1 [Rhodotorula paludigena]|uniref:Uncharacterized protein n=1 Tax=Rhodotorula paludigena TaxID=86838 RepID=A0AAV5GUS9_9BASI|nr:hypothetical protein Rhopal_007041-T1 [Rhodotorula paludigena]